MDPIERLMNQVVHGKPMPMSAAAAILTDGVLSVVVEQVVLLHTIPNGITAPHSPDASLKASVTRVTQAFKDGIDGAPAAVRDDATQLIVHGIRCAAFDLIKACDEAIKCGR